MKKMKNNLDEMQEQRLLKIERNGFWFAFWGLAAALLIQMALTNFRFEYIIGEFIVFMFIALYIVGACIRHGIWDRKLKPEPATNLILSLLAGLVTCLYSGISNYLKYHMLFGSLAAGIIFFIFTFIMVFTVLSISTYFYKRRVEKLNSSLDEKES